MKYCGPCPELCECITPKEEKDVMEMCSMLQKGVNRVTWRTADRVDAFIPRT